MASLGAGEVVHSPVQDGRFDQLLHLIQFDVMAHEAEHFQLIGDNERLLHRTTTSDSQTHQPAAGAEL